VTGALAPDAAVPRRELLLDGTAMREPLSAALGAPLAACEAVRAKYRVGESLRVLYRVEAPDGEQLVSLRTFPAGRCRREALQALGRALPAGELAPVGHLEDLGAVVFTFPNDRKLRPPAASERQRVVAYAPEVRVTLRRDLPDGRPLAYLKHLAGGGGEQLLTLYGALGSRAAATGGPRLGQALGYDHDSGLVWLAPVDGAPVDDRAGMHAFGDALARLHGVPRPPFLPLFERLHLDRVEAAARVVAAARPDVRTRVCELVALLRETLPEPARPVLVHGDAHPKNCLLGPAGATLIDLDQAAIGPAAADLGGVLARLERDRLTGRLDGGEAAARAEAFLVGYAGRRPLPAPQGLEWYRAAALLVESALRAVNRVYHDALAVLDELLAAALCGLREVAVHA
jgi:hypothetical protein